MSIAACNYIYDKRNIPRLGRNNFKLIQWLNDKINQTSSEQESDLILFSVACASETLITDYLSTLANDNSIQEICRKVTSTHLADERSHSGVFSQVAINLLKGYSEHEIEIFKNTINDTLPAFADTRDG